jgi:hypothetical protein
LSEIKNAPQHAAAYKPIFVNETANETRGTAKAGSETKNEYSRLFEYNNAAKLTDVETEQITQNANERATAENSNAFQSGIA